MRSELHVKNSFCELVDFNTETIEAIDTVLTTHNDIEHEKVYLMKQIKYFKSMKDRAPKFAKMYGFHKKKLKDLLASEYVHWLKDGKFPTGHLNIVRDVLETLNVKYTLNDHRKIPEKVHEFYLCNEFHEPRYYQKEMHEIGLREGRGVFESAVGTGKTMIAMRLLEAFGVNSLIIVPSKALLDQWQPLLENHFARGQVIRLNADELSKSKIRKLKKKPIRLINIQALAAARKKGTLKNLIEDLDMVIIDEFHHAGSKSFTDLLEDFDHIYYRFGFTGTFLRNDTKTLDMWGFLSNALYRYPAYKAIKDGFLTPIEVRTHRLSGVFKRAYQSEYNANYCGFKKRMPKALLKSIHEIITKEVKKSEPVLILVNRKDKCGKIINKFLESKGIESTYISGDSKPEDVTKALEDFNAGKIQILIGSQIIGEGIDVRAASHLILANGGKSEIGVVQATGRLVRLNQGKTVGILHDFKFLDTKYLEKHAIMRHEILKRNFAPEFVYN